jgi:predicted P-loop ATPase
MKVSFYPSITKTNSREVSDIISILENIKNGVYEDYVYPVRNAKTDKEKKEAKSKAPCITTSGTFSQRGNDYLLQHSGLIAIDFDHLEDIGDAFNLLINDVYSFAVFRSISGNGLCAFVKIDGRKHLEAFLGLERYYWQTYNLEADRACKDVSRPRYLSYDPDLFLNEQSQPFKDYVKRETKAEIKAFESFKGGDHYQQKFERVLSRVNCDITQGYDNWVKLGFAIASEYGESGLDYFKQLSQYHPDYDAYKTEKKYRSLLGDRNSGITIRTFYYLCKLNGIDISDERETKTRQTARKLKTAGKTEKQVIAENPELIPEIVAEEFAKHEQQHRGQFDIEAFEIWLRERFRIKKNEVTRFYEMQGKQLEQSDINTIYIDAKKQFPKVSRDIVESVIFSNYTPSYNPIKSYFEGLKWDGVDHIAKLAESINSNTGTEEYREFGLRAWLIGIVESILKGKPNILCLVLAGKQNTGKSTFFTRLLPEQLNRYFAMSQLDRGKDDEILMCQSLLIFDDEFSGKSKQDAKHMKRILSAPSFTLREPYGRNNVTLKRIATLCGTCNELDVLNDPTGNRRFIVFEVVGQFDYKLYNSIDKNQLFAQCVALVNSGETSDLQGDFVNLMEQVSEDFLEISIEEELLLQHFNANDTNIRTRQWMPTTMIKDYLEENSNQKLSIKRLGQMLRKHNFERIKRNNSYGYMVAAIYLTQK